MNYINFLTHILVFSLPKLKKEHVDTLIEDGNLTGKLSILGNPSFQRAMYVAFFIFFVAVMIYIKFSNRMTRYKSNMIKVTDDIYIPEPAGQGQYGTAHFLEKKELDKKYKYNILDENDPVVKKLLEPDKEEDAEIKRILDKGGISKEDSENLFKNKNSTINTTNNEDIVDYDDEYRLVLDYNEDIYFEPEDDEEESEFNLLDVFEDDDLDFCRNILKLEKEKVKREEKHREPYSRRDDPNIIFNRGGVIANIDILPDGKNKIHYISSDLHTIDLGATRSGKTRCFILPTIGNQALAGHSIVVSDPKGELYQYTNKFVKKLGYEVVCLDFKNPDKSTRYNLLQPIIDSVNDYDIDRAINYTEELSNILVGECKGERIWHDGQKAVITGSILSTIIANKDEPEKQNLASVYRFINDSQGKSEADPNTCLLAKYIKFLQDKNPTHPAIDNFAPIINAAEQTRLSFISGAMNTLRLYSQPSIWKITHKTDINLTEMGERKQILYIILPDENTMYYPIASI
ncbi:MAG: type IV secretory system conjugative DNA transfer family protein, partial [Lachnospiraceae bacterium]|nr:type IV secretory system conjugative DNA transfer family protein [Lachnospiraceae bacterium]